MEGRECAWVEGVGRVRVEREREGEQDGMAVGGLQRRAVADSWCHVSYESALRGDERKKRPRVGAVCGRERESRVPVFQLCGDFVCSG